MHMRKALTASADWLRLSLYVMLHDYRYLIMLLGAVEKYLSELLLAAESFKILKMKLIQTVQRPNLQMTLLLTTMSLESTSPCLHASVN